MEIKKIKKQSYEKVSGYLNALIPWTQVLNDMYFYDFDDKRHLVTTDEAGNIIIIENDDGVLSPLIGHFDENGNLKSFCNELYSYDFGEKIDNVKSIRRVDKLHNKLEELTFNLKSENNNKTFMDYFQMYSLTYATCIHTFDVTSHDSSSNLAGSFVLTNIPDVIQLYFYHHKTLNKIPFYKQMFLLSCDLDYYYKAAMLGGTMISFPFLGKYDFDYLSKEIREMNFKDKIPKELVDSLNRESEDIKTLNLVYNTFNEHKKGQ